MSPERPDGWLLRADSIRMETIIHRVSEVWKMDSDPHKYTPHDPAHFKRVEQNICNLIPIDRWPSLLPEERFLLSCAAWTHDVAMNASLHRNARGVDPDEIRRKHVEESVNWVMRERRSLGLSHSEATVLAEINLHHSRKFDILRCSELRICSGVQLRPRLLAAYLRLADAMEVAHERVDDWELQRFLVLQEAIAKNADETLFHWIKSFVVSGIAAIPSQQRIIVEFQIPTRELPQDKDGNDSHAPLTLTQANASQRRRKSTRNPHESGHIV